MYLKKIYKVQHYLDSKLNQHKYSNLVKKINHPTLSLLFKTITQIKNSEFNYEDKIVFEKLKAYRKALHENNQTIDYSIFGIENRIVSEIYQSASSSELWSRFHYLLTKNLKAKYYLEIGTNLGVSGSYILSALKKQEDVMFITMEGVNRLSDIAQKQFEKILKPEKFRILRGLYENTFPELLNTDIQFDILFIDGNHHYEPTLQYFEELKEKTATVSVFVFDDIYWNEEMKDAWNVIKKDHSVNYTVDLFKMGIVIIDKHNTDKPIHTKYFLTR